MIYPDIFEQKIGIDTVREYITEKCLSPMGEEKVKEMAFMTDYNAIIRSLTQVDEFMPFIKDDTFPVEHYTDLRPALRRIAEDNTLWLNVNEIRDLADSLATAESVSAFFRKAKTCPALCAMSEGISMFPALAAKAVALVDTTPQVRDNASRELADLRRQIAELRKEAVRSMQAVLRDAQKAGIVSRDAKPNMRDGHLLIPVDASNKRKIKGMVHSGSGSGKTVYIEPQEVAEANRKLSEAENAERREVVKLLIAFTELVRPNIDEVICVYDYLAEVDFIRAKALFANRIAGICPAVEDRPLIEWNRAVHPLLNISLLMQQKHAHPLDIRLMDTERLLIVSGANAGGKSLCLKTVALLQYMLQCGVPIPVAEGSKAGIFDNIFIDIGDGQSIQNSLSTYTAHLGNMKYFLANCNSRTLILIDEFGSGTEPQIGGAMAEAILERFNYNKCFGVITTHFHNLKQYAHETEGLVNGAMLYDAGQMKPLYTLAIGIPGSSFAVEVARNAGLPGDIITSASSKLGHEYANMDNLLQSLIHERIRLEGLMKQR